MNLENIMATRWCRGKYLLQSVPSSGHNVIMPPDGIVNGKNDGAQSPLMAIVQYFLHSHFQITKDVA